MSDPKRIWLQQPEDPDPMYAPNEGDRTWCENPIEAEDTEYVRADLYESLQTQLDAVRELSPDALILLGWMTKAAGAWTTGEMRELTGLNHPHRAAHELVAAGLIKRLPETYFKTPRMAALEQEQEQGAKLKEMVMSIDFEFATRDDCLDRMVPSDLRALVSERDRLQAEVEQQAMRIKVLTKTVNMQADALDAVRAIKPLTTSQVTERHMSALSPELARNHRARWIDFDELEAKLKEAGDE